MSLITDVIESINRNGRQGPRNLDSDEVYSWVESDVSISRPDYSALLAQNAIADGLRSARRDAYFIRDSRGRYSLFKSNESELRGVVCAVIALEPGMTSDKILRRAKLLYAGMTPVDFMLQQNLNSPQEIIDQTIRNILTSNHRRAPNAELFARSAAKPFTFTLTAKGRARAQAYGYVRREQDELYASVESAEQSAEQSARGYSQAELEHVRAKIRGSKPVPRAESGRIFFPSDPRLKATCKQLAGHRCQLGESHSTFATASGALYTEAHHIIPMAAQSAFPDINLDCPENIIVLCPICHRAMHYGTASVKRAKLSAVLAQRAPALLGLGFDEDLLAELISVYYE